MIKLTLVMTEQEAEVLMVLVRMVSGNSNGPRGFANRIDDALDGAGVLNRCDEYLAAHNYISLIDRWPDRHVGAIKCERLD